MKPECQSDILKRLDRRELQKSHLRRLLLLLPVISLAIAALLAAPVRAQQVASVRAPLRLARRTASETCAASRSRCSAARANDARPEVTRTG